MPRLLNRFAATVVIAAAPMFLLPATASAEDTTTFTFEMTYDDAALAYPSGATFVLEDLRRQARQACTLTAPITQVAKIDRGCMTDVVHQAVSTIDNDMLSEAYTQDSVNANPSDEDVQVASAD